jgi:hypothetical protein
MIAMMSFIAGLSLSGRLPLLKNRAGTARFSNYLKMKEFLRNSEDVIKGLKGKVHKYYALLEW